MLARVLLLIVLAIPLPALAQLRWTEGRNYTVLSGQPAESRPGKIEVAEVFSYGCIHCYRAKDIIGQLQAALPADAYMSYVHASFMPAESWPMFQRAWYTAQAMGIGTASHKAMFEAVWETHELGLPGSTPGSTRKSLPTIEEAARFYARVARVKEADFLRVARSAGVEAQMKRADALIKAWRIPGTPALVVNGRYLINNDSLGNWGEIRDLVLYLIGQERRRMAGAK